MNINLISNNSTFGEPYTTPPKTFTVKNPLKPKEDSSRKYVSSCSVPKKGAYFVNANKIKDGSPVREAWGFGRLIDYTRTSLSHLNPNTQFIPAEVFDNCERIPIKELADRNIAVLASEGEYTRLGDVGAESRRQSFYHNKTTVHPNYWDSRIDDLVKLGFHFKPVDMKPINSELDDAVINVSSPQKEGMAACIGEWEDEDDVETEFKKHSANAPFLFDYEGTVQLLACPIIEVDRSPQHAVISSVYSPDNPNFSKLIRHPDTALPMLSESEAIKAKHTAFLDYYDRFPCSVNRREFSNHIREAQFFNNPYGDAIKLCDQAIEALKLDINSKEDKDLPATEQEKKVKEFKTSLDNTAKSLKFAKDYMVKISDLVSNAILYDDINLYLNMQGKKESDQSMLNDTMQRREDVTAQNSVGKSSPVHLQPSKSKDDSSKSADLPPKNEQLREDNIQLLIDMESFFLKEALDKNIIKKSSTFPLLHMHTIMFTSLGQLIMENSPCMDDTLKKQLITLRGKAHEIVMQLDDRHLKKDTLCSLKAQCLPGDMDMDDILSVDIKDSPPASKGCSGQGSRIADDLKPNAGQKRSLTPVESSALDAEPPLKRRQGKYVS